MQCYATDTVALISLSERLGFLDAGEDVEKIEASMHRNTTLSTMMGVDPSVKRYIINAMGILARIGIVRPPGILHIISQIQQGMRRRMSVERRDADRHADPTNTPNITDDMLTKFLRTHFDDPQEFAVWEV